MRVQPWKLRVRASAAGTRYAASDTVGYDARIWKLPGRDGRWFAIVWSLARKAAWFSRCVGWARKRIDGCGLISGAGEVTLRTAVR